MDAAKSQALVAYEKDLIYRRWNADHGGVYAEVTEKTQPNRYLSGLPERDIKTPSGKLLTMINPAYMFRQVSELSLKEYGVRSHLTSLKLVNPSNAPDPWEKKALLAFEQGAQEVRSVEMLEEKKYMRLMRPLLTEKKCLACHTTHGYKEGDIRGGISVSVPVSPLMENAYRHAIVVLLGHAFLWIVGLSGVNLGARQIRRSERERSEMETQLRKLSHAVEQSPTSMVITDLKGNIEFTNAAFSESSGYSSEEAIGKNVSAIKSGLQSDELFRKILETVHEDRVWRGDICTRKKDGESICELVSASPIKDLDGEITNSLFVKIDDTERKRAEEALWKSEEKFRSISASAQDAIIMKDNDGNISFWNKAAEKIFGYKEDEVMGKNLHKLLSPQRYHEVNMAAFEQFRKTGKGNIIGTIVEVEALKKDGTEIPIELSISAVKLDGNWNAIGIIRDVSDRKRVEKELKAAKEAAEAASSAKSYFLATMSHELRTPLNAIIGFSEILIDGIEGELTKEQKKDVEYIHSAGSNLLGLVNDILDLSKIEAEKLSLENNPFDLRVAVNDIRNVLSPTAAEKGVELKVEFGKGVPTDVEGDSTRITQIILNFTSNAIKFTDKGSVTIRVRHEERTDREGLFIISVEDTGIGIPEDKLETIFEKFTQADSSVTRKHGGTGLGLTITKKLAELMGGTIGVSSKVGRGSIFWCKLPLKYAKDAHGSGLAIGSGN
ncbi:MAG: PAS domain S-box protein [Deltaproteobacteria bacterium]